VSNLIHPTAVIEPSVKLGQGNYIGPFCYITGDVQIGDNNRFEAHCSIGTPPEHTSYWHGKYQGVRIGDNNVIREFVTINSGTTKNTIVRSDCVILRGSYIGHDSYLEDKVTVSCNAVIAGNCHLFTGCNLGMSVSVHQYSVIGHYSMLGMSAVVTKKSQIMPGHTYVGVPARLLKKNTIGLQKNQITDEELARLTVTFSQFQKKI